MSLEDLKVVSALAPVTDAFSGNVYSDAIDMKYYNRIMFIVVKGVGLTGTSTITVEKCSAANGADAEAIPFSYRRVPTGDTAGTRGQAQAAGFTTSAGSDEMYLVSVSGTEEGIAKGDKPWVRLKLGETVDSPVAGTIICLGEGGRYGDYPSALT